MRRADLRKGRSEGSGVRPDGFEGHASCAGAILSRCASNCGGYGGACREPAFLPVEDPLQFLHQGDVLQVARLAGDYLAFDRTG